MMVVGGSIAAVALLSGGGLARADYPPVPENKPPTVTVAAQTPAAPAAPAAPVVPAQLPSTGSGIDTTLMLAGSTLLAGIGIAGVSSLSRRRRELA
jgi:hypothetical protein